MSVVVYEPTLDEREFFLQCEGEGKLTEVDGSRLRGDDDIIVAVMCADGSIFLERLVQTQMATGRLIHPLSDIGGAYKLDPEFRDSTYPDDVWPWIRFYHIERIAISLIVKRAHRLLLKEHCGCAEVKRQKGSVVEQLPSLVRAHHFVKAAVQLYINNYAHKFDCEPFPITVPTIYHRYQDGKHIHRFVNVDHGEYEDFRDYRQLLSRWLPLIG